MARIAGEYTDSKKSKVALTYIYGIGHHRAQQIINETSISIDKRVGELTDQEI